MDMNICSRILIQIRQAQGISNWRGTQIGRGRGPESSFLKEGPCFSMSPNNMTRIHGIPTNICDTTLDPYWWVPKLFFISITEPLDPAPPPWLAEAHQSGSHKRSCGSNFPQWVYIYLHQRSLKCGNGCFLKWPTSCKWAEKEVGHMREDGNQSFNKKMR